MTATGLALALLVVMFAGGALFVWQQWMAPDPGTSERLQNMTGGAPGTVIGTGKERDPAVQAITERLSQLANPSSEEEQGVLKNRLIQAGYTARTAPVTFNALRVGCALLIPLVIVPPMAGRGLSIWVVCAAVPALAAFGYYIPVGLLDGRIQARQQLLMHPFPDALDLLVSSVEAGLGLDSAFRRVADEIEGAAPELAKEFHYVTAEINAGTSRIEALKHLSVRTGLDEVQALVNMLTQAERFGTSVARSLRVHSNLTRQKRAAKAEEEAAKVSPKLTIVMILFLMPCLIVVLLGPAVVAIKNNLL
jgi:tight adherence protein C